MSRIALATTAGAIAAAARSLEGRPPLMAAVAPVGDRRQLEENVWTAMPAGHKRLTDGERHILHTDPATGSTSLAALKTLSEDQLQGYLQEAEAKEAAAEAEKLAEKAPHEAAQEQVPVVWAGKTPLDGPGVVLSADGSQGVAWQPVAGGRVAVKMFDVVPGIYASLDVTQRATVGFQTRSGDRELSRLDASEAPLDQAMLHLKIFSALGDAALGGARVETVEPAKVSLWAAKGFDPYAELKTAKRPAVIQNLKDGAAKMYQAKEVDTAWLDKHRDEFKLAQWCPDMTQARAAVKDLEMRRADVRPLPDSWPAPAPEAAGEGLKKGKDADNDQPVTTVKPLTTGTGPFAIKANLDQALARYAEKYAEESGEAAPSIEEVRQAYAAGDPEIRRAIDDELDSLGFGGSRREAPTSGFYRVGAYDRETGDGPLQVGSGGGNFQVDYHVLDKGTGEKVGGPYETVGEARRELGRLHKKRVAEHFAHGGQGDKDYEKYVTQKKPGMVSFLVASLETLNAPLLAKSGRTREALDQFKAEQRLRFQAMEKPDLEKLVRANSLWAGWNQFMAKAGAGIQAAVVGTDLALDLAIRADIYEDCRKAQETLLPHVESAFKAAGMEITQDVSGGWYVTPSEPLPMLYLTPWWEGEEGKIGVQVSDFGDGDMLPFKTTEEALADPEAAASAMVAMAKSIVANSKVIPGGEGHDIRVDFQA